MSQPPTSSPSTKSCGIVGQFDERGELHVRVEELLGDARGEAAARRLGRALHEEHHAVLGHELLDLLEDLLLADDAHGVTSWDAGGTAVLIDSAWIAPEPSSSATAA